MAYDSGQTTISHRGETFHSTTAYDSDVVVRTEAGINAPDVTILAKQLSIEVRVHLNQQSSPATFALQVQSV